MNELGFYYIYEHEAWLYTPNSSLIFMHELFVREDEEIRDLVFERTDIYPADWVIEALKYPYEDAVS